MLVTIQDFQSLREVTLTLEGLTTLVGPSDRGKSALVRALQAAFFNRPGEYFVRTGADTALVRVEWPGHVVEWEKGSGVNRFVIDGVLYSKVGQNAPEAIRAFGFRDELIGARMGEAGKPEGGKWVRPQFAGQFDELYLLTEPGTFINEVIVKLSRLGVLQRASRQCALDLRQTRSLLKTRQSDLTIAAVAAEQLAEAPLLRSRLDMLRTMETTLRERQLHRESLRTGIAKRASAKARLTHTLPVIDADRSDRAQEALQDYRELIVARSGLLRRTQLVKLPKRLPPTRVALDGPEHRALLANVARRDRLQSLIGARSMRQITVGAAVSTMEAAETRYAGAADKVAQFKASTPVCPLCAQPWSQ
jgi:hypothetical protein